MQIIINWLLDYNLKDNESEVVGERLLLNKSRYYVVGYLELEVSFGKFRGDRGCGFLRLANRKGHCRYGLW